MVDGAALTSKLNQELARAVGRGAFALNFQPIFDARTGRATAFEALLRWRMQDGRTVSPAVILAIAEDKRIFRELTSWTMHAAAAAATQSFGRAGIAISVNVTFDDAPAGFVSDVIGEALAIHDLPRAALALEISEYAIASSPGAALELTELAERGHAVYVDDFRLGGGSMARLREIAPAGLKTERAIVGGVDERLHVANAFQAVAQLAQSYGLPLIAKGVERRSEFFAVRSFGADAVQGFLFGRPGTLESALHMALDPPNADVFEDD